MTHDLDIIKCPDATFARWSALDDQMPSFDWNKKVIKMAKLKTGTAKLDDSTLTTANTFTMHCCKKV